MPDPPHPRRRGHVRRARRAPDPRPLSLGDDIRGALLDPDEAVRVDVHGGTDAAVLVPLFVAEGHLHVVFTRRREDLRRHGGEISFPGGRADPGETLVQTALREAEEEVGLPPADVELLGALTPTPTVVTGYAVYPFVGLVEPGRAWRLSPREVDEVLELRVADLRAGFGRRRLLRRGVAFRTDVYVVGDALIWGATARMLGDLLDRLAGALGDEGRLATPGTEADVAGPPPSG